MKAGVKNVCFKLHKILIIIKFNQVHLSAIIQMKLLKVNLFNKFLNFYHKR